MKDSLTPFVTIVMPICNEADFIARSLGSVLAQDYPAQMLEVIVIDGLSTDGTRELVRSFQASHAHLRMIDNPARIVAPGLNAAMREARGEVIVRVDGHCEIAPDYVQRCVRHLQEDGVDGVGGPLETIGESSIARIIAHAMSSPFGVGNSAFRTVKDRTMLTDTVAFPAYTREAVERGGFYDEELVRNQDDEYNYRLRKLGAKILLAGDVHVRYYSRGSLRSLWRQYFQYGYWKVRVMQKHPRQMRLRQFIPALFVLTLLLTFLLMPFLALGVWLPLSLLCLYAAANLCATLLLTREVGWRAVLLLPLTFATLHFAYGTGMLAGLAAFRSRWREERPATGIEASADT